MATPKKDTNFVQIPLRSKNKHQFNGETVVVHKETCFVLFTNLVKVVCGKEGKNASTAHEQINQVLSKMNHTQYLSINGNVFVSSNALNILFTD